jgi:RIO kinase 1
MSLDSHAREALAPFLDEGLISEILYDVKSGKEATVFCCRAPGENLLAAKVYRPIESRRFKNDSIYLAGRVHMVRAGRAKRAVQSHTAFGREVQYATWVDQEWQTLRALHAAGVDVPQPLANSASAILMPFLGDERDPAPILNDASLEGEDARVVVDQLLGNIELMLHHHVVHGDLSPFNVLLWRGEPTIIDFPQAVDPRLNPAAEGLLRRDVENICRWGQRCDVHRDGRAIAADLWARFVVGELG